jgi:hypothetical protein
VIFSVAGINADKVTMEKKHIAILSPSGKFIFGIDLEASAKKSIFGSIAKVVCKPIKINAKTHDLFTIALFIPNACKLRFMKKENLGL